MSWNKTKMLLITGMLLLCCICGFGAAAGQDDRSAGLDLTGMEKVPVEIFIDYQNTDPMLSGIMKFPDITEINDDEVLGLIYTIFGPTSEESGDTADIKTDACSCFYVPVNTESGTVTLMGRNLDLDQSVCPGWIFYTDIPGKYKSFNMGYFEDMLRVFGVPTMDQLRENPEIPYVTYQILTYVTTDAVNEKGLFIEVNMRNQTDDLVCTGTNPSSEIKVCNAVLIRYLIDRCATIDDVLSLVKTLDIYSPNPNILNSQFALSMMDATGRCGVMEFVGNEIVWHDCSDTAFWNGDTPCHTNYWITPEAYAVSNSCNGESRYEVLQDAAKSITSEEGMWNALAKIYRKQFFTIHADQTTYDVISDCGRDFWGLLKESLGYEARGLVTLDDNKVQEVQAILNKHPEYKDKSWDAAYLKDQANHDDIITCYNFITDVFNQLTPEIKREDTQIEYAAFTYVAESGSAEMRVKFFEHPEEYTFGVDYTFEFQKKTVDENNEVNFDSEQVSTVTFDNVAPGTEVIYIDELPGVIEPPERCLGGFQISAGTGYTPGEKAWITFTADSTYPDGVVLMHGTTAGTWEALPTTYENGEYKAETTSFSPFAIVQNTLPPRTSSSVTSFSGTKDGNDFTFDRAVVITKATLPGASSATVTNTSGSGWYTSNLSTDATSGVLYFQVPLDVISVKGYTVNDVSMIGCKTTYLSSGNGYAKYSAVIAGAGSYTIDFEKDAAKNIVETKPVTETPKTQEPVKTVDTPVTSTPVTAETPAAKSPAPVFGILAGLGIAGVLLMRRK